MAEREKLDMVRQSAIQAETIRKELRHLKLRTEISINPRTVYYLPDKPMSRKPEEVIAENPHFSEAYRRAQLEPNKKYKTPQTASQEIGWMAASVGSWNRNDDRLNFPRHTTDITKYTEIALRASGASDGTKEQKN